LNLEAGGFEQAAIEGGRGKEAGGGGFSINVKGREGSLECGADGGDVAVTSHLGDEAGLRIFAAECVVNAGEHRLMASDAGDPVEGSVGEDRVELLIVGEGGGVVLLDLQIALAGGFEHGRRRVDACDDCAGGDELLGESAIAAAKIEDVLAGLGGEEGDDT